MIARLAGKLLLGAALLMPVHFANAQGLPASAVSEFIANPAQMLTQNPTGGGQMTRRIRDLVTTDKSTLAAIMSVLKSANTDQQSAIAEGLAQAAKIQAQSDPAFANEIQAAVAASGIPEFVKQYASIAGDTGTAATGGGGGTGGGGPNNAGAPTGGQNNGPFSNPNTSAANNSGNPFTGLSLGGSSFSSNITTFTTTINNNSVSPN